MKKKLEKPTEEIFCASIEFNSDYIKKYGSDIYSKHLKLDEDYPFGNGKISGEKIANVLRKALDYDLLPELQKQNIPVFKVKSISVNEGCITISFLVQTIISAVIKELIKRIAEALLTRILIDLCGGNFFVVNVNNVSSLNFNNAGETKRDTSYLLLMSYFLFTNFALIAMVFYLLLRR